MFNQRIWMYAVIYDCEHNGNVNVRKRLSTIYVSQWIGFLTFVNDTAMLT